MILWIQNLGRAQLVGSSAPSAVGWGHSSGSLTAQGWTESPKKTLFMCLAFPCSFTLAFSHSPPLPSLSFLFFPLSSPLYMSSFLIQQSYPVFVCSMVAEFPRRKVVSPLKGLAPNWHNLTSYSDQSKFKGHPWLKMRKTEFINRRRVNEWQPYLSISILSEKSVRQLMNMIKYFSHTKYYYFPNFISYHHGEWCAKKYLVYIVAFGTSIHTCLYFFLILFSTL